MSAVLTKTREAVGSLPFGTLLAALVLIAILLAAIFAPWIAPYDPNAQNLLGRLKPPGFAIRNTHYLFGSDELGRDTLSRLIYGARVSLLVAFASVVLSGIIGSILGMIAALHRGVVETIIMRLVDIVLSVPAILLAIITVATLGPGLQNVVLVLALTRWPRYARVAYGQTLVIANTSYLRLSRSMGAGWVRVLRTHVLPNIAGALVVVVTLEFGLMVLFEAGLSFLGLGVQPPTASWGAMLSVGRNYVANAWWLSVIPGTALFLLVLSVNVLGDFLRDRLDPRSR
ncbi:ABC transporter permease [Neorhizobium sp. NCHU2750]|uniref:ABC transporter permease n=1 Tax=Neorhizobium sp. NCHU2750 TaxID=1825976 RepID=UPI000E70AC48|nr:peptide/nickel ABC transporter permease [Neorhizobium sp. NCHU2750]